MRIVLLAGRSRSLINFRGPLIHRLLRDRHHVIAAAPKDQDFGWVKDLLKAKNVKVEEISFNRGGINPIDDYRYFRRLSELLDLYKPEILIAYTAKPVIYGGIAARRIGGIRFFPLITGLGYAFVESNDLKRLLVRSVVERLYRQSLSSAETVIFQNPDDEHLFHQRGVLRKTIQSAIVNGSGVDLDSFPPSPLPAHPTFLLLARLLADKGIREYVEAARIVGQQYPKAVFRLAGGLDSNPAGIDLKELQHWIKSKHIEYLGEVRPAQHAIAQCRFYVLPSYREGTPRSVLEAMATGRPIITTDAPGCRQTVEPGVNGLLVPPRDAATLADAMIQMLEAPDSEIQGMADASLAIARQKFDVHRVNQQMMEIMGL
jgi:glycosyltransferase involved in cell wall biosynthesis